MERCESAAYSAEVVFSGASRRSNELEVPAGLRGRRPRRVPKGKFIYLSSASYLGTWNPYGHTLQSHNRMQFNCLESLIWFTPPNGLSGLLAESWEQIDPTTVEVKLRRGVKFHNGQDFTAEDVKASLEYASDPKQLWSYFIGARLGVEALDRYKVRIMTEKPDPTVVAGALASTPMCCKEDVADPARWEKGLNGTGPFSWVRYEGESSGIQMTANLEYRAGPPRVKDVVFRIVADSDSRLAALQSGEAHVIDRIEPEQVDAIEADPNLDSIMLPANEYMSLWFRMGKEPLKSNRKLRQAIAYAIDRDTIIKEVLRGIAYPVESFLYRDCTFYSPAQNYPKYDPDRSKKLLAEAGYPGGRGLRTLEYVTSVGVYPKSRECGEAIVKQLKRVGIPARLNPMPGAAWLAIHEKHDVGDMIDCGFFCMTSEQDTFLVPLFHSPGLLSGDANPEIDAALEQERAEGDPEARKEKLAGLNELLADHLPGIALFQSVLTVGISRKVKGFSQLPSGVFPLWDVEVGD